MHIFYIIIVASILSTCNVLVLITLYICYLVFPTTLRVKIKVKRAIRKQTSGCFRKPQEFMKYFLLRGDTVCDTFKFVNFFDDGRWVGRECIPP